MIKLQSVIGALAIVTIAGALALGAVPQQATKSNQDRAGGNPVHTIVLPDYSSDVPSGPNVDTYRRNCLVCHSARYVIMQPPFPRVVWEKEVKKMVDVYGAVISESDQREIVEYLVAVRGPSKGK